ncbi:MAG: hypothetical protein KA338_28905 [Chloroflexi bacterium]|nr:hypothetical protein [Chloroflexota bacterium]
MSHHVSETASDAAAIAIQLQETESGVITQIARIGERMGSEFVQTVLADTLHLEAEGGMLTEDKQRRRTPGGVFFYLVRGRITAEDRKVLFPRPPRAAKTTPPTIVNLSGTERQAIYAQLKSHPGVATNMKLTLVGRPAKILKRDTFVAVTLASGEPPALPKGLPALPSHEPTVYLVYIASKQWRKLEESIQNPEDKLIIEGYPFNDKKMGVIGVLTQSVTTVNLQRATRDAGKKSDPT